MNVLINLAKPSKRNLLTIIVACSTILILFDFDCVIGFTKLLGPSDSCLFYQTYQFSPD